MDAETSDDQGRDTQEDTSILPPRGTENKERDEKETGRKADHKAEHDEANPEKQSWFQRFMHKHFPEAKPHDRWTLVFTAVIAFSTFFYMIFAGWTLLEIHSGSQDTHTLAVKAGEQATRTGDIAGAANKIATAADKFSGSADSINQQSIRAVKAIENASAQSSAASRQAAKNAEATIKTAQDSFRDEQRAWVGAVMVTNIKMEVNQPISFMAVLTNSGKTPALHVKSLIAGTVVLRGQPPDFAYRPPQTVQSDFTIQPGMQVSNTPGPGGTALTDEQIKALKTGDLTTYLYGKMTYLDISKRTHHTTFCVVVLPPELDKWAWCDNYNEAD